MDVIQEKFWNRVEKTDSCWNWTGYRTPAGYGQVRIPGDKVYYTHRLSAELHGMQIDGMCVCHHCDNPMCVNPNHFFIGTKGDNNRDRSAKGRSRNQHSVFRVANKY